MFEVYKPKERLKDGDIYRSEPNIAAQIIRELKALGFRFKSGQTHLKLDMKMTGQTHLNSPKKIRHIFNCPLPYV